MLLTGCSSDDEGDPTSSGSASASVDGSAEADADSAEEGGSLAGLPACDDPPDGEDPSTVEGLLLPAGSVLTSVDDSGRLVTVQGYVEATPVSVRASYEQRDDIEVFEIEDEVFEAEVLYGQGEFRTYVKALATCAEGSTLTAVVGPAGADEDLPTLGDEG